MIVYKTTNLVNNKVYIGKDGKNNPNYLGSGKLLQLAIKKYGRNKFKKEILFESEDENLINQIEKLEIKKHKNRDSCYNIAEGGTGGFTTKYYSKEEHNRWINNLSKANKNRKFSLETREKISQSNRGKFYGDKKTISDSVKKVWSDPNSVFNSDEYRKKLSKIHLGRKCMESTKEKISKANSGSKNGRAVSFDIEGIIYKTRREAAIAYSISEPAVTKRCKSVNFPNWNIYKIIK